MIADFATKTHLKVHDKIPLIDLLHLHGGNMPGPELRTERFTRSQPFFSGVLKRGILDLIVKIVAFVVANEV